MSNPNFEQPMTYLENPNPNNMYIDMDLFPDFDFAGLLCDDAFEEDGLSSQSMGSSENPTGGIGSPPSTCFTSKQNCKIKSKNGVKKKDSEKAQPRFAFRTKTEIEVMDDGYKWRKYGKKSVKNSPNPRNYYKCSNEGCIVKKRIEKDGKDSSYVITTYEGIHNHEIPSLVYYDMNPVRDDCWLYEEASISSTS